MEKEICKYCGGPRERCWINAPEYGNCVHLSIAELGKHTLQQVAERMNMSLVNVFQIEKKALQKLKKRAKLSPFLNSDTN